VAATTKVLKKSVDQLDKTKGIKKTVSVSNKVNKFMADNMRALKQADQLVKKAETVN